MLTEGEPKPHFQVALLKPDQIFDDVQLAVAEGVEINNILSDTLLDGRLFTHEYTQIETALTEDKIPYYCARSTIYFSDIERLNPPHGLYSLDRVNKVQKELERQGLQSSILNPDLTATDVIIPGEGDAGVLIEFGPKSRQHIGNSQREMIEGAPAFIKKLLIARAIEMANATLVNEWLNVHMANPHDVRLSPWCYELKDKESFTRNLEFYTRTYEKIIKALYRERGIQPPTNTLILCPQK